MTGLVALLALLATPPDLEALLRAAPAAADRPGAAAVYLRRDRAVEADGTGRRAVTQSGTLLILSGDGRNLDRIDLGATGAYQSLRLDWARMVRADGQPLDLGATGLRSRRLGFHGLPGGDLLAWELQFPYVEPGAVLDWSVTVRDTEPSQPEGLADRFAMQTDLPVESTTYTVRVPAGTRLADVAGEGLAPALVTRRGEWDEYRRRATELAAVAAEPGDPLRQSPGLEVLVSATTWEAVAERYRSLSESRCVPHQALSAAVARETAGAADPVPALYRYVATQIRYSEGPFERSVPSIEPHPAHRTFDLRAGDCKDQATLLITMLREAGIEAVPALLRRATSGPIEEAAPAMLQFDHVLVAVPTEPAWRLLDPTWSHGPIDYPPPDVQGAKALVLAATPTWREVPTAPAEANSHRREAELSVAGDGTLSGRVEVLATGLYERSLRWLLRGLDARGLERTVAEALAGAWGEVSVETTLVACTEPAALAEPFAMRYDLSARRLAEATSRFVILRPAVFEQVTMPDGLRGPRRRPVRIAPAAGQSIGRTRFRLGDALSVADLPADESRAARWGSYAVTYRRDGDTVAYEREVTITVPVIAAAEAEAAAEWFRALAAADRRPVVLARAQP